MSNLPRVVYASRPDSTQESERAALASVYRFILDRQARKKGGAATAPDDVRKDQDAHTAAKIIPDRA